MPAKQSSATLKKLPKEFFTIESFGTLSGCIIVAWIVATSILFVFRNLPVLPTELVVSILVAYTGLFLTRHITKKLFVVTLFNGFLIFISISGGLEFLSYVKDKATNKDNVQVVEDVIKKKYMIDGDSSAMNHTSGDESNKPDKFNVFRTWIPK